jgi:Carboxypeptidase regulatory-like domain
MTFHLRLAIFCAVVVPMAAQTFRGGINGSVEDASGAVLDGVKISAVNESTGFSRVVLTGSTGEFSIPELPPGVYSVSALKRGRLYIAAEAKSPRADAWAVPQQ